MIAVLMTFVPLISTTSRVPVASMTGLKLAFVVVLTLTLPGPAVIALNCNTPKLLCCRQGHGERLAAGSRRTGNSHGHRVPV